MLIIIGVDYMKVNGLIIFMYDLNEDYFFNTDVWMIDGTFKTAPNGLGQILNIFNNKGTGVIGIFSIIFANYLQINSLITMPLRYLNIRSMAMVLIFFL